MDYSTYLKNYPSKDGRFGKFGGAYLPPQLVPATAIRRNLLMNSAAFAKNFKGVLHRFIIAKNSAAKSASVKFISSAKI